MRILLDTHCWLWMQVSPDRFSAEARAILIDSDCELLLSAASSWELAIKWAMGRLSLPVSPEQYVPQCMQRQGVKGLPVEHRHALHTSSLPLHHRDPFDRLIIAQSILEKLKLMTADRQMAAYEEADLIWA